MTTLLEKICFIQELICIPGRKETVSRARKLYLATIRRELDAGYRGTDIAEAYLYVMNSSFELGDIRGAIRASREGMKHNPTPLVAAALLTNSTSAFYLQGNADIAITLAEHTARSTEESRGDRSVRTCGENLSTTTGYE